MHVTLNFSEFPPRDDRPDIPRKAVICFQCGLISSVPKAALSARCHHCGTYISLDHIVLHQRSPKTLVQTRGDVTVKAGTDLQGMTIHSHNLLLLGRVSGQFNCSGTCQIKTDQQIAGLLRAYTLIVDKKVTVTLAKGADVHHASIHGTVHGTVESSGTVTIHRHGTILGDIKCLSLVIEDGGTHFGHYFKQSVA